MTRIKRILYRVISVPKEELELTEIISGQPLSDIPIVVGIERAEASVKYLSDPALAGRGRFIKARPMHLQQPLASIAEPLGLEVWVRFYEINGIPVYYVEEPPVTDLVKRIYIYLKTRIGEVGISTGNVMSVFRDSFEDLGIDPNYALGEEDVKSAIYYVWRDLLGYGPLEIPMEDIQVEEVSWYGYDEPVTVVDKEVEHVYPNAEFVLTNIFAPLDLDDMKRKFLMTQIVRSITSRARAGLTTSRPITETRIPDPTGRGFHRLAAHLDITSRSPGITIRKFPAIKFSLTHLIDFNTLSELEAAYLLYQLIKRGFILIVGAMASGKTTLLQALISALPVSYKVVCVAPGTRIAGEQPELIDNLFVGTPVRKDNMETVRSKVKVLGFKEGDVVWSTSNEVHKIYIPKEVKLVKITTEYGTEVTVTPNTKIPVLTEDGVVYRTANEIKEGDVIPQLTKYDVKEEEPNVLEILEQGRFRVHLKHGGKNRKGRTVRSYTVSNWIKAGKPDYVGIRFKRSKHVIKVPVDKLPNPEVSYLAGYIFGDGSIHKALRTVHVAVSPNNKEQKGRIEKIIRMLGLKVKYYASSIQYVLPTTFGYYLEVLYEIPAGEKSSKIRVPKWMFNAPIDHVKAFLAGVIDSDSSVTNEYIDISSKSKEFIEDIAILGLRLGVVGKIISHVNRDADDRSWVIWTIKFEGDFYNRLIEELKDISVKIRKKGEKRKRAANSSHRMIPTVALAYLINTIGKGTKREKWIGGLIKPEKWKERKHINIEELTTIANKYNASNLLSRILNDKYIWVYVKKVEQVEHDGVVYDLSPKETKYFFAGNGGFIVVEDTVEDTPELSTPAHNWHPLYVRRAPKESELEDVDYSRLVIHSLRHRGTVVTLGEVRGAEMADLIQAAASGHAAVCLRPYARVLVRVDGKPRVMWIKELVHRYDVLKKDGVEVLSVDLSNNQLVWRPVTHVVRVEINEWVRVETVSGRRLDMTPDHGMPVRTREGKILIKDASELLVGEKLLIPSSLPRVSPIKRFAIVKNVYVELNKNLGRMFGLLLTGRRYSNRISVERTESNREILSRPLGLKINILEGKRRITLTGAGVFHLLNGLKQTVKENPLSLPNPFLEGLWDVIRHRGLVLDNDQDFLHSLHFALKTIGVDSVVKDGKLKLLGRVNADMIEDVITRIERVKPEKPEAAYDIEVLDTHTFITDSSITSMNCTFHAHDPFSVLARITSPPINAAPESLKLITSIVHIAYTKTFVKGEIKPVRRVMRIFEIEDVTGRNVTSTTIFKWNPQTDVHTPSIYDMESNRIKRDLITPLAELWTKSRTIRTIGLNTYGDVEPQRALSDILALSLFLREQVNRKVFDIKQLLFNLTAFYLDMDNVSQNIWNKIKAPLLKKIEEIEAEKE